MGINFPMLPIPLILQEPFQGARNKQNPLFSVLRVSETLEA